jgi:hypothetical protein
MSAAPTALATMLDMAVQRAVAAVESLDEHELTELAAGRGELVFQALPRQERALHSVAHQAPTPTPRQRARRTLSIDIAAVVETINAFATPAEATAYLESLDNRYTLPVLKEIARACGPTVSTAGRTKAQVQRDIVAGTIGFRSRSAAMSDGAWA